MGIELALMAAGTALSAYNKKQAAGRAEGATREGLALQAAERAKATGAVNKDIGYLQSSNPEADRAAINGSFLDTLRANSGRADASTPAVAGADPRYAQAVGAANTAADTHTSASADFISRIMAAARQRQTEGNNIADTGVKIGGIQQDAGIDAAQTEQNVQRAGQPDPWMSLGASLLTNAGTSGVFAPKAMLPSQWGAIPGANPGAVNANAFQTMPTGVSGPR